MVVEYIIVKKKISFIKVYLTIIILKDLEFIFIQMEIVMKENGKITINMEKELFIIAMEIDSKDNLKMD